MRPIERMRKAQAEKNLKVEFEFLGEQVMLSRFDMISIQEEIAITHIIKKEEYAKRGLDKIRLDEKAWRQHIDTRKAKLVEIGKTAKEIKIIIDAEEDKKPTSEADRLASEFSAMCASQEIIPTFLQDPKTGALLFTTDAEKAEIAKLVKGDVGLMTLLSEKFMKLTTAMSEIEEVAKN